GEKSRQPIRADQRCGAASPLGFETRYHEVMSGDISRIMKAAAAPIGQPWLWTLAFGHHEDRTPTHGYEHARGCDGSVREELATRIGPRCQWRGRWRVQL